MLPPPEPIVWMSMIGIRIGKRKARSRSFAMAGLSSTMMPTSKLVPPMSAVMTLWSPAEREI